jgi:5-methylcytosine-specific restriction enzyme A
MEKSTETILRGLKPSSKTRVYDLLSEAGFDVSDWANFRNGERSPATNPKYCYEWSFTQNESLVLLNLWHESFSIQNEEIICELNMRTFANEVARAADDPWRENRPPRVWEKRAQKLDQAIQLAHRKKLPIRVIVCEGEMRDFTLGEEEASKVKKRMLDPASWEVESYDWTSGQTVLIRRKSSQSTSFPDEAIKNFNLQPSVSINEFQVSPADKTTEIITAAEPEYIDQFSEELQAKQLADIKRVESSVYPRSAEVRNLALKRAQGICQLCGQAGFLTSSGKQYLETHHIIPLSEGGEDTLSNVVALCATDHKRAHFSSVSSTLQIQLLEIASIGTFPNFQ